MLASSSVQLSLSRALAPSDASYNKESLGASAAGLPNFRQSRPVARLSLQGTRKVVLRRKCFNSRVAFKNNASAASRVSSRSSRNSPRAVMISDPATSEGIIKEFNLEDNSKLQVAIKPLNETSVNIELNVTNSSRSLLLHWGAVKHGKKNWTLPSNWPEKTHDYKKRALRTAFQKSGENSFLRMEISDQSFSAIEFTLYDETRNKWIKYNGQDFHIDLPIRGASKAEISIPEELVQIQAYLRWERNGKQMYSAEKEKEEYEAARRELQELAAKGLSIDQIRARLQKGDTVQETSDDVKVPEDLIQVQSYLRWEKAGKPNYNKEKQQQEFQEAKKDLERELSKGISLSELRKQLQSGDLPANVAEKKGKRPDIQKINRKKRDVVQLINRYPEQKGTTKVSRQPKEISKLELKLQEIQVSEGVSILQKKIFKFHNNELIVFLSNPGGRNRITLVTDMQQPLVLHWSISKNFDREWTKPPADIMPEGSSILSLAYETPFNDGFCGDAKLKFVEIDIGSREFFGLPFVLRSDGNWIKDNGSDFYFSLRTKEKKSAKSASGGEGTVKWLLEEIAEKEREAEKSFMHRFNIAADLTEKAKGEGELALSGILVWMRFMATRQLTWNKNYNVKPREISAAQDRLTDLLKQIFSDQPHNREIVRLIMATVGRGGQGDVGQRIRDEILVMQRNNDCKGGMMEEWHQKLHNNTSPDDVVICQALLDYVKSDFNMDVYWNTLISNGVTKERLASYDRKICSEPRFRRDQREGLIRDLTAYMRTLKAVHSGADLESAIAACLGYSAEGYDFMTGHKIPPVSGLSSELPGLLHYIMDHVEDRSVCSLVEALLEARFELRPMLLKQHDRLKDIIYLDLALDSTVRTAVERGFEQLNNAQPSEIIYFISMVLENLALSTDNNEELVCCLKGWYHTRDLCNAESDTWPLYAKAVLDRTRLALFDKAEHYSRVLQPSAEYLGSLLNIEEWAVDIFTEEMIRAGSAASLSLLLNRLDPKIRKLANLGSWQVISPVEVSGFVSAVDELAKIQNKVYDRKTILVANRVKGEEEIPDGVVALLTPDMPDVLSHVSVRARNSKVCFATCFDQGILDDLRSKEGKALSVEPTSSSLNYKEINESQVLSDSESLAHGNELPPGIKLKKKHFSGKYAISSDEFTNDLVGAKSRNIGYLRGKLPSWVRVPVSVALPFGVFEKVLSDEMNKDISVKIGDLQTLLAKGDFTKLQNVRETVLHLNAPPQLVSELKETMKSVNMPWPGDEGEDRWQQAWTAIKKVWASKWNERAYISTRKANIDHTDLCMAVLVQEIINADYAFVIHTTNPSNGDSSEIYAEIVRGLGETLVGAYPGRAMSFVTKKSDLSHPKILGYPSKPIGLFIRQSIIFRSDSNGEDLEGYAGAGLYDSIPMDTEEKRAIDYSSDPLVIDPKFQQSILSKVAQAGHAIEELYGSPQDVEGVIKDGELYVVQTRPQM